MQDCNSSLPLLFWSHSHFFQLASTLLTFSIYISGLHYKNPYPRAVSAAGLVSRLELIHCWQAVFSSIVLCECAQVYLPPLGLATQKGRRLRTQQRLRKQAKPIYLQSQDETWCDDIIVPHRVQVTVAEVLRQLLTYREKPVSSCDVNIYGWADAGKW